MCTQKVGSRAWVYACRGERLTLGIFLICSPPTFFETRSLTQLRARKSARVDGPQALRSTYLCSPPQCWAHPHTLPQQVFLHTVTIWTQVLMLTEHVLYSCPRLEIEIAIFFQKYSQKHNIHRKALFFLIRKFCLSRVQRKCSSITCLKKSI